MQGLNHLVKSGKVLYLGISGEHDLRGKHSPRPLSECTVCPDTPAWIVSSANRYARDHGLAQFVVYQGKWSVIERDFERDILDMARHEGMALAPWNVLGGGKFQTKAQQAERDKQGETGRTGFWAGRTEEQIKISDALEKVAGELGTESITAVALAYVMQKQPYVFPVSEW